jgi:hypothetical protein
MSDDEAQAVELTRDELVVLAGAVREMMKADGIVTSGEIHAAGKLPERLGLDETGWMSIWDYSVRALPNLDAVMDAAGDLRRVDAREVIYELLYEIAQDGSIVDAEWDMLEWLDEAWRLADSKRSR